MADYSAFIRDSLGGIGKTIAGNRQYSADLAESQAMMDYRRSQAAQVQANSDRSYALDMDEFKLKKDAAEGGGGGPFAGTALDAQYNNILLKGDPASPEYAMAYTSLYLTPKSVQSTDESGKIFLQQVLPTVPFGIRPPAGMGGGAAPPPGGLGAIVPPPGDPSGMLGDKVQIGTKPPTEAESAGRVLLASARPNYIVAKQKFDALGNAFEQVVALGGNASNFMLSDDYQIAKNAVTALLQAESYARSGATMGPGELAMRLATVMPAFGDKPGALAQKKKELDYMLSGIAAKARDPNFTFPTEPQIPPGLKAPDGTPVTEEKMKATMKARGWTREQVLEQLKQYQ